MKKLLFICTGNTCRSPMAAAIAEQAVLRAGAQVQVLSAGIAAVHGVRATSEAHCAMRARGLSLQAHRARCIGDAVPDDETLVLTMTAHHAAWVRGAYPTAKVLPLATFIGERGEVRDPYGGTQRDYDACAAQLADWVPRAVARYLGKDVSGTHEA